MRVERIALSRSAPEVLRCLAAATTRLGLPPPAALTGEWFGSRAVIAPSVAIEAVHTMGVFDVDAGSRSDAIGGGWIGYLSYPDAGRDGMGPRIPDAAGGWTDEVLRLDADENWWYENLSGAAAPAFYDTGQPTYVGAVADRHQAAQARDQERDQAGTDRSGDQHAKPVAVGQQPHRDGPKQRQSSDERHQRGQNRSRCTQRSHHGSLSHFHGSQRPP